MANKKGAIKRFTFNDPDQQNSHGFLIPTEGISLTRFEKNPVMLDQHWNSTHSVIGRWNDVKVENGLLTALPEFDTEDEYAKKIAGKVDRDYIKGCSMGITFKRDDLKYVAGKLILEKCELYEVSIVAVPSNANSIHLYHEDGQTLMSETDVQKLCLSVIPTDFEEITPETKSMKIKLISAAMLALGLSASQTEIESDELNQKIIDLDAKKTAAELKLSERVRADESAKLSAITTKVKEGIVAGKLSAEKEADYIKLGVMNESLLDTAIGTAPEKASLAAQVKNTGGKEAPEVKTADDFQKLSLDEQLTFKNDNFEQYTKIFS